MTPEGRALCSIRRRSRPRTRAQCSIGNQNGEREHNDRSIPCNVESETRAQCSIDDNTPEKAVLITCRYIPLGISKSSNGIDDVWAMVETMVSAKAKDYDVKVT
jgi:hypothetical protein